MENGFNIPCPEDSSWRQEQYKLFYRMLRVAMMLEFQVLRCPNDAITGWRHHMRHCWYQYHCKWPLNQMVIFSIEYFDNPTQLLSTVPITHCSVFRISVSNDRILGTLTMSSGDNPRHMWNILIVGHKDIIHFLCIFRLNRDKSYFWFPCSQGGHHSR